ncbi:hypothetical protein INR49_031890, partial [Caranx melampygus]
MDKDMGMYSPPVDLSFKDLKKMSDALLSRPKNRQQPEKMNLDGKYVSCSMLLSNNQLPNIIGLLDILNQFLVLCEIHELRSLYLHGNSIPKIAEVDKLRELQHLRSITLHGNGMENHKGYRTSTSSKVLPVQIQTIKSMSPEEFDGGLDECLAAGCCGHHDGEPAADIRRYKPGVMVWLLTLSSTDKGKGNSGFFLSSCMFDGLNDPDDIVASVGVWWGCRGRGPGYCEQCVMHVEGAVADAHVVHLLTELKPQLLVLLAQVSSLSLQSVSKHQSHFPGGIAALYGELGELLPGRRATLTQLLAKLFGLFIHFVAGGYQMSFFCLMVSDASPRSSDSLFGVEPGAQLLHAMLPVLLHKRHVSFMQSTQALQTLQVNPPLTGRLTLLLLQVIASVNNIGWIGQAAHLDDAVQVLQLPLKCLTRGGDFLTKLGVSSLTENCPPAFIELPQKPGPGAWVVVVVVVVGVVVVAPGLGVV